MNTTQTISELDALVLKVKRLIRDEESKLIEGKSVRETHEQRMAIREYIASKLT